MLSLPEEEQERIRRAYFIEHKSIRTIAKEMKHGRSTIAKAIAQETSTSQQGTNNRQTPVFGPHQSCVEELLSLNEHLPAKQHYTSHKIFEIIQSEGYIGSESHVIVTTNLRFADWNSIFGDNRMTAALLDRLTHKAHILEFIGESYRFRQRLLQTEAG
jgi:transposase